MRNLSRCKSNSQNLLMSTAMCVLCLFLCSRTQAAEETVDERRVLIARAVCVGFGANFANTDGGDIKFQAGRFQVKDASNNLTVFEGAVKITEIPGFIYGDYTRCVEQLIKRFEYTRRKSDSKATLEAFNAALELNAVLSIGLCVEYAARYGLFFTDEQGLSRLDQNGLTSMLVSASESISSRTKRFMEDSKKIDFSERLEFYRYYPDKPIPYFRPDAINYYNTQLESGATTEATNYIGLGKSVGKLTWNYMYLWMFSRIMHAAIYRADDDGARARAAVPPTLGCLQNSYLAEKNNLESILEELNISGIDIPNPQTSEMFNSSQEANKSFSHFVTIPVRRYLKNLPE